MIRLPTSRSRSLSSRSKAMVVAGVGSAWTNRSRSRGPRASKPESRMTRGSKVVVNRVLVGVGWIIEGLRVGVKAYVSTISPKMPLLSNILFPLPVLAAGKSAITPISDAPPTVSDQTISASSYWKQRLHTKSRLVSSCLTVGISRKSWCLWPAIGKKTGSAC